MTLKNFKKCNFEEFEDKNCSYKLNYYSISDHMNYYNNYVGCEDKENWQELRNLIFLITYKKFWIKIFY